MTVAEGPIARVVRAAEGAMRELLVIVMGDSRFALWRDKIHSLGTADELHHLPFASAALAGMAVIDGRLQTLADLAACIGCPPLGRARGARVVLMPEGSEIAGFAIGCEPLSVGIPENDVRPLPRRMSTPFIDSCAILDSIPLPIINIDAVCHWLSLGADTPPVPRCSIGNEQEAAAGPLESVRLFAAGGEPYAMDARAASGPCARGGAVSAIPGTPPFIRGIARIEDDILPIIDLALFLRRASDSPAQAVIVTGQAPDKLGLLVDEDAGKAPASEGAAAELPRFLRTPWMRSALFGEGRLVPLIEPDRLLSTGSAAEAGADTQPPAANGSGVRPGAGDEPPLPVGLTGPFGSQDIDVVEISLNGLRHALPRSEVEDVIDPPPFHGIPHASDIVAGAAEWKGEILPVLDIGGLSGGPSAAARGPRALLVRNGDFRAVLVCEQVFDAKTVRRDLLRPVPVALPHGVVYGCYTEAQSVRLILNLRSLTLFYEKSRAAHHLPAQAPGAGWASDFAALLAAAAPPAARGGAARIPPIAAQAPPPEAGKPSPKSPAPAAAAAAEYAGLPAAAPSPEGASEPAQAAEPPMPACDQGSAGQPGAAEPAAREQSTASEAPAAEQSFEALPQTPPEARPSEEESAAPTPRPRKAGRRPRRIAIGILVAGLAAALYLVFRAPTAPEPSGAVPTVAAPAVEAPAAPSAEAPTPAKTPEASAPEKPTTPGQAADTASDEEEYSVVRGDTLWDIAEQHTGNPFKYHDLARINGIENPDLIEVGRRLRLK